MKIQRPGNTEFSLMLANFCEMYFQLNTDEKKTIINIRNCYVDWIYKTAGYYDKDIKEKSEYTYPIHYTPKLHNFINEMLGTIKDSNKVIAIGLESLIKNNINLLKYLPDFEKKYNTKIVVGNVDINKLISTIKNKRVLVISPFKELINAQIVSGNLYKINPELLTTTFLTYKFPYTFLNNGPHNDSFETLEIIKNDIQTNYNTFDIAILSCGCYGGFLTDMITSNMKKDAIYVGGQLPLIFGIIGKRDKWAINQLYNKDITYLINGIPEEFRPTGWEKIEDGCYW